MARFRAPWGAPFMAGILLALSTATALAAGPPEAFDDAYETPRDTQLQVPRPGVLGNDSDPDGDPLSVLTVVAPPSHGSLTLNADGSLAYTPDTGFVGSDVFYYEATDGAFVSNVAEVRVSVTKPTTDPPDDPTPPCEPVVDFVGQAKDETTTPVKSGQRLRVQVAITCDGAHAPDLEPVLEVHQGDPGTSPLTTGVMTEKDDKYVRDLDVPRGLPAGTVLTVAVRPLGAGTAASLATIQIRR